MEARHETYAQHDTQKELYISERTQHDGQCRESEIDEQSDFKHRQVDAVAPRLAAGKDAVLEVPEPSIAKQVQHDDSRKASDINKQSETQNASKSGQIEAAPPQLVAETDAILKPPQPGSVKRQETTQEIEDVTTDLLARLDPPELKHAATTNALHAHEQSKSPEASEQKQEALAVKDGEVHHAASADKVPDYASWLQPNELSPPKQPDSKGNVFRNFQFHNCDPDSIDVRDYQLENVLIVDCKFRATNFWKVKLTNTVLLQLDFRDVIIHGLEQDR